MSLSVNPFWYFLGEVMSPPELPEAGHLACPLLAWSHWAMLSRVCDLQQEIATFLRQKNLPHADHFSDPRWLAHLTLLTDITTYLNAFNVKLQGKEILVTNMHSHITAFHVN